MSTLARTAAIVAALAFSSQAYSQVVFYQGDNYSGRSFSTQRQVPNFNQYGFNDRASSVVVLSDRVSSAHAVMGRDNQRCWVEREQVDSRRTGNVGGAVAGGAIGYNPNRDRGDDYSRDVERCTTDSASAVQTGKRSLDATLP